MFFYLIIFVAVPVTWYAQSLRCDIKQPSSDLRKFSVPLVQHNLESHANITLQFRVKKEMLCCIEKIYKERLPHLKVNWQKMTIVILIQQ